MDTKPAALLFDDFRMDLVDERLWRGDKHVHLTPKAFAMLRFMAERAGQLVTKAGLLDAVWTDTAVSESVLTNSMRELRRALGDQARAPQFIETVHRRGYRFVAPVTATSKDTIAEDTQTHTEPVGQVEEAALVASRRQLTVMFCDLVGSTALTAQLDPEDYGAVVQAYHTACKTVVQNFDGYIAQLLGDGLLIYFGYPQAHEDDAVRAVRAALAVLEAFEQLKGHLQTTYEIQLAMRVGIHTGWSVVEVMDDGSGHGPLALGPTPNLAARLQALADSDSVLISADTYRLVEGHVICQPLGSYTLRGWPQPLEVFRVLRTDDAPTRFAVRATHGLTPMVGRAQEFSVLCERWNQVKAGRGHAVLVSGEAGMGKSRLLHALKDQLVTETLTLLECQGSPYYQHTTFEPLIELLQGLFQWQAGETPAEKWHQLAKGVAQLSDDPDEALALLAALLRLPLPEDSYPLQHMAPQQQRQKTFDTLVALFDAWAAQQPMLILVEDFHWIDPSTCEFLELLIRQVPAARLLTVVTSRPTVAPSWVMRPQVTHLHLDRLEPPMVDEMIRHAASGRTLPVDVRQHIAATTDGVPLFVEEVTKLILEIDHAQEAGGEKATVAMDLIVPATVQDLLMARLDQAGSSKAAAQLGAVLGRSFDYGLLQAVAEWDDETLQQQLRQLVAADLVYQRGVPPLATYVFKHALVQEVAYQSLLKRTRQQYHQRIAEVLAQRSPESVENQPELLAYHCMQAGLNEPAIDHWQRAGQLSLKRSAYAEAIHHFTTALKVLESLPETAERHHRELALRLSLGSALIAVKGYAAPEVEQTYNRARELCEQIGETPRQLQVLLGLHASYFVSGALKTASEVGQQCLALARQSQDPARLLQAHYALGAAYLFQGEVNRAQAHLDEGIALNRPQYHQPRALQDPGVTCLAYAGGALWLRGYVDQSLQRIEEAVDLARRLSHAYSLAHALYWSALVHVCRREWHTAREHVDASMAIAAEHRLVFWLAMGTALRGQTQIELEDVEEGLAQLSKGLAMFRSTGAAAGQTCQLSWLFEAQVKAGQVDAGLETLGCTLKAAHKNGEYIYIAELYRLKGEMLRQAERREATSGGQAAAESCFHQALAASRQLQMKSWELRTAISLGRLWQQQGKDVQARELLAPIYEGFTEGWDTPDLQDAKALLARVT